MTWILLRGLTREARHWGAFTALFAAEVADGRLLALDLPGNGALNAIASPTRIDLMTDFCRDQLVLRGIAPPYRLLAISMGGMVATDWTARFPQEIDAAVLINTSMRPFSPFYQRLRLWAWLYLLAGWVRSAPEKESMLFSLTSNLDQAPAGLIDSWVAIRRSRPVATRNALRQLLAAARYCAPKAPPPAALLVLASAGDQLVDTRCSQTLARYWGCPIGTHPAAGHDLPLDDPSWVVQQVRDWLSHRARAV